MRKPSRIGLAGGYCAGKNEAARILEARGFLVLDMDAVGHEILAASGPAISDRFGPSAILPDGRPDRGELGRIVFSDPEALRDLEAILHPAMGKTARAWMEANEGRDLCVNAALLHRMDLMPLLDAAIEIRAPLLARLLRGMKRDGLSPLQALRRILNQRDFPRLLREAGKPVIAVLNDRGRTVLETSLEAALAQLSLN